MPGSWSLGARLRQRLFLYEGFLEAVLIYIALCMNLPSTTSQAQTGFLSIDCGYTGASYNDSNGLTWVTDETFIMTGKTAKQFVNTSYPFGDYEFESVTILQTYRYFPESRSNYCYNLATTLSVPYLLRASFFLNGSLFNQSQPFQFNTFINANNWFTISSGDDPPSEFSVTQEAIFYPQQNITFFCLQPIIGVPFISSLELRPLQANMYSYYGSQKQYLVLLCRWNLGSNSTVRFPDDNFDRIWYDYGSTTSFDISMPTPPDDTSRANVYYVPPKVMQDGWLMSDTGEGHGSNPYSFGLSPNLSPHYDYAEEQVFLTPEAYAFAVLYTEYLNTSDSRTYSVDVYLDNDITSRALSFSHNASMQAYPNLILSSNKLTVELRTDVNLTRGPTLNAFEVYGQVNYNFSSTDPKDVNAIEALKTSLSLKDWQGDPCSPVPYDWLSCSQDDETLQSPCGLNVTSVKECPVEQGTYLLNSTYTVIALNFSNLATNDLSLFTNASGNSSAIHGLRNLTELTLTNCGIDTQKFRLLVENFLLYENVFRLDVSYNSITSIPDASVPAFGILYMNMSHNALNATVLLTYQNLTRSEDSYNGLVSLDLSYNAMSFLPSRWINTSYQLDWLDLSHNLLQGQISNLDELIGINKETLQTLDVSHNYLTEKFNSSLYFSSLSSLIIANFDQNLIGGTLDLTPWYDVLQSASGNASIIDTLPLFSFVNNSISDIFPSADTFEGVMLTLTEYQIFHQKGILLGGNPYCKGATTYTQRYFCRFLVDDSVPRDYDNHTRNKDVLIISICTGVGALILSFALLATLWKLWKQVYQLREIQQAFANRKVQPPFYPYNELKLATRDFHNEIGRGSFGVVYKAILADNTTVAVKMLSNSQRLQELDEFLNEVVITGIKHKNLVQLKGCCIADKKRMLIYEYVENGNLAETLWGSQSKVHGPLNWEQCFNICVGVARGLSYLHEELQPSIIHRDIKPENVLLDRNFGPRIADFGLARQFEESSQARYTQVAGTFGYFAPEYASEGQLSSKADVFSFGILVLEVVSGRKCIDISLPFEEKILKDWVRRMHRKGFVLDILQPKLRGNCDEAQVMRAINIGLLCIQQHPDRRPSMSTVVTMFLGSADVEVFLDESDIVHSDFNTLLLTNDHEFENPTLQSILEGDSPNFHLFDRNSKSSSSNPPPSKRSSRSVVELCTISG